MSIKGYFKQRGLENPQPQTEATASVNVVIKEVPTIVEKEVVKYVDVVREVPTIVEKEVIKYIEVPVEKIVEVIKEVPVEKIVQVEVEKFKEVVKEVPVFMDRIVTRVQTHRYVWIALGIETLVLLALMAHNLKG